MSDLTGKGRVFPWEIKQQEVFYEVKRWLQKPPVQYIPYNKGKFYLCSDTSRFATGTALYQI